MRTPKFTDTKRYANGYVPSNKTDVAATFRRIRRQMAEAEAERQAKVREIKEGKK